MLVAVSVTFIHLLYTLVYAVYAFSYCAVLHIVKLKFLITFSFDVFVKIIIIIGLCILKAFALVNATTKYAAVFS